MEIFMSALWWKEIIESRRMSVENPVTLVTNALSRRSRVNHACYLAFHTRRARYRQLKALSPVLMGWGVVLYKAMGMGHQISSTQRYPLVCILRTISREIRQAGSLRRITPTAMDLKTAGRDRSILP